MFSDWGRSNGSLPTAILAPSWKFHPARKQGLIGLHRMSNMKQIVVGICLPIAALFSVPAEAADVVVVVADRTLHPDQIVLQAGESVQFDSELQARGDHTLVIVDEADQIVAEYPIASGSSSHRFENAGIYHFFVKEFPSIAGNAVVFPNTGATADLRQQMVSYSIGYDLGQNVVRKLENLDLKLFNAGIEHAYTDQEPKLSHDAMEFIVNEVGREVARRARDERERIAALNLEESQEFLGRNAQQPGVVVLPSGLQYKILKPGSGPKPKAGMKVRVHHKAMLLDGTEFDNTYETQPAEFFLTEGVLPGYSEGLKLMSEGARWKLFVPPRLAYGIRGQPTPAPGAPAIAPNTTLIFEVELLAVGE